MENLSCYADQSGKKKKILKLAPSLILENGGETYRAEQTALLLCKAFGAGYSTVLSFPTGIYISISCDGESYETIIVPVRKRSVNLSSLDKVNTITRGLCEGSIAIDEALQGLSSMQTGTSRLKLAAAAGAAAALFSLLFSGSLFDGLAAFACGFITQLVLSYIKWNDFFNFIASAIGGALTAAVALAAIFVFKTGSIDHIITGAIMPLVPGLALTNAIRDIIGGDLMSGGARLTEALFIAISLAAGAGVVLSLYLAAGGAL